MHCAAVLGDCNTVVVSACERSEGAIWAFAAPGCVLYPAQRSQVIAPQYVGVPRRAAIEKTHALRYACAAPVWEGRQPTLGGR